MVAWSGFVSVADAVGVVAKTKLLCVRKENCELMEAAGTDEVGVPEVRDTEPVEFVPDGKMIESDADCEGVMTGAEPLELPLAEILPEAEMLDPEGVLTG